MLDRISTKLGQNDQWVSGYKSYQQFDLKGHVGVTGVKKVIFTENATPRTHLHSRGTKLMVINNQWVQSSTKVITLQFDLWGHFKVTGVKKVRSNYKQLRMSLNFNYNDVL